MNTGSLHIGLAVKQSTEAIMDIWEQLVSLRGWLKSLRALLNQMVLSICVSYGDVPYKKQLKFGYCPIPPPISDITGVTFNWWLYILSSQHLSISLSMNNF